MVWNSIKGLFGGANGQRPSGADTNEAEPQRKRTVGPAASFNQAVVDISGVAAQWQAQAKSQDDQSKAAYRAHVQRPVPPLTDAGAEAIRNGRNASLLIKHVWPPQLPERSMSFLGGSPVIPDNFDWPMLHTEKGLLERLTFMGQIDCEDIPQGPARALFPAKGYIYFFAPMSLNFGSDANHFVVRYLAGPVKKSWEPQTFPFVGDIAAGRAGEAKRSSYPKVEIALGWLEEPTDQEVEDRRTEGLLNVVADLVRAERRVAFFGMTPTDRRLSGDVSWLLDEAWPCNRTMARTLRTFISQHYASQQQLLTDQLNALGDQPYADAKAAVIRGRKTALTMLSSKAVAAFDGTDYNNQNRTPPLTAEQMASAKKYISQLLTDGLTYADVDGQDAWRDKQTIFGWMSKSTIIGTEAMLNSEPGPEVASVPEPILAALAARHNAREHHMLGEGKVVQTAADDMKDSHILLIQLGYDPTMEWLVGEMGPLQYWITPEDMAAKRFENSILTIEGY